MVASHDFRPRNYELFSEGTLVGYIGFNNGVPGTLGTGNNSVNATGTAVLKRGISLLPITLPNATVTDPANEQVSLSFELNGRTIGQSNTFMTLYTGILKVAPFSIFDRVENFLVNARAFRTVLSFQGSEEAGDDDPHFEYGHLIALFTQFPPWVLAQGQRWTEGDMVVQVDGKLVGAGVLRHLVLGSVDGGGAVSS